MARTAKKAFKTKQERLARQGSAQKRSAVQTRQSLRKSRSQSGSSDSWLSAATTLVSSAVGRAILAEVLVAIAEVLKKNRGSNGETDDARVYSAYESATDSASTVNDAAKEAMTGVLARTAAGALAEAATSAVRRMLPKRPDDDEERKENRISPLQTAK